MYSVHLIRYLWQIFRQLPGSWKQKKRILSRIEGSIQDYVSEGNLVTYVQLVRRFGKPEQIAAEYINSMEAEEFIGAFKSRRNVLGIVLTAVVLALLMWAGFLAFCYYDFADSINGTLVTEEVSVIGRMEY